VAVFASTPHFTGVMPKVNWSRVKRDLKFELGHLLHWKIDACFDLVDSSCAGQPVVIDIDYLLLKEQADIYVAVASWQE
jgi:hypothetical protein